VVLAAGGSTRMGRPKALLSLGDDTYLGVILATLRAAPVGPVVVVLGSESSRIRDAVSFDAAVAVDNPRWRDGMLGSLKVGVASVERIAPSALALLMCLVDTPRFSVATVTSLVTAFLRTSAPIIKPSFRGEHGHPVLFSRALWPEVLSASGDGGPRVVVDAHRDRSQIVEVPDEWILRDADTPAEHDRLVDDVQ
jgi:molybdenum cofactor cytidylyltransferase